MDIINNIDNLLGDDLKTSIKKNSKLSIVASCFSIYAYKALKKELESVREIEKAKTHCARRHFEAISSSNFKYDVVDSYERLLEILK